MAAHLGPLPDGVELETWRALLPVLSDALLMFDSSIWIYGVIFFLAAGMGVLNTMLMATHDRVREYGLLKALGTSPLRIVIDVSTEAFVLALLSTAAGALLGIASGLYLETYGLYFGELEMTWGGIAFESTWDGRPLDPVDVAYMGVSRCGSELALFVDAPFHGDPPPFSSPGSFEGLWNYEAVELFIAGPDHRYLEVELGPHGHHLVLTFHAIRERSTLPHPADYVVEKKGGRRWRGAAMISSSVLPAEPHRFNAYSVHGVSQRCYNAHARVPGTRPDHR